MAGGEQSYKGYSLLTGLKSPWLTLVSEKGLRFGNRINEKDSRSTYECDGEKRVRERMTLKVVYIGKLFNGYGLDILSMVFVQRSEETVIVFLLCFSCEAITIV